MTDYQKFAISNFRSGLGEQVEPWLLPRDAYQQVINAHLYRGVLEKIEGYSLFASMSYRTEVELTPPPDGTTKTFTTTLTSTPTSTNFFGYGTIVDGSAETFSYLSDGTFPLINLVGSAGGTGTLNLTTLVLSLTFNSAPPNDTYSDVFFQYDSAPASMGAPFAIMCIEQYYNSSGGQDVMVFDQRRVGIIKSSAGVIAATAMAPNAISEIPHDYYEAGEFTALTSQTVYTGTLTAKLIAPGAVQFLQFTAAGAYVSTITDNGTGGLQGTNVTTGSSFINYVTGAYQITFATQPTVGNVFDATAGIYGDIFTGSISNFFTLSNYQYSAFFTNSVDPIFYYDGFSIHYLDTNLETKLTLSSGGIPTNYDITRCLHLTVNRERLILLSPTVLQPSGLYVQQTSTAIWSAAFDPFDFTNDEVLQAPTSQPIRAFGYVNSDLIVRFASSERVLRYTGDAFSPFRWDSTNNIWDCDSPYSGINYDTWFSTVGKPGIVGSDGVNVKRVDELIPDFTDPTRLSQQVPMPFINQTSIIQCYGERFDDIKEGWLCYNNGPQAQDDVTASDNVLAFNYQDKTYAVYSFPFSCLGFGRVIQGLTWGAAFETWESMSDTWNSYDLQSNALADLAGDQYDRVYRLNDGNYQTLARDPTFTFVPVLMSIISKNFNPFIEDGELARLGYVDLFVSAYNTTTLRVQFFINDELYTDGNGTIQGYYQETVLTFNTTDAMSPIQNQTKVWKRIYIGAVGKTHTIRFYQNAVDFPPLNMAASAEQPVFIHSMVLYMKPAGRIFN